MVTIEWIKQYNQCLSQPMARCTGYNSIY